VLIGAAVVPAAAAGDTPTLSFVGTPSVTYAKITSGGSSYFSFGTMFRLNNALPAQGAGVFIAPRLRKGQRMGSAFGGNPPGAIGTKSRHCYVIEPKQPRPIHRPTKNARWRVGITRTATIQDTATVTLRAWRGTVAWQKAAARRLGCYA
jgi:hypothetical protein